MACTPGVIRGATATFCVKDPGKDGCGTVTIMAARADDEVRDRILTARDTPQFLAAHRHRRRGRPGRRRHLRETPRDRGPPRRTRRHLGRRRYKPPRMAHRPRRSKRRRLASSPPSSPCMQHGRALAQFATMDGTVWDLGDTFSPTGGRRALIQSVTAAIPVRPATSRLRDPDRSASPPGAHTPQDHFAPQIPGRAGTASRREGGPPTRPQPSRRLRPPHCSPRGDHQTKVLRSALHLVKWHLRRCLASRNAGAELAVTAAASCSLKTRQHLDPALFVPIRQHE